MSSFWYDHAKYLVATAGLNFGSATLDALLVMTNTTADTEKDKATVGGFTTLDEYDGSGYSRKLTLGQTVTEDNTNHLAMIDCADFSFGSAVAAGTRQAQGMVAIVHNATPSNAIPIAFIDTGGFPFAGNGGAVNVVVAALGLLQIT